MVSKKFFINIVIYLLILCNIPLYYLYTQKNTESEIRLVALYNLYEGGLYADVHLTNVLNLSDKKHLLYAYADLYSALKAHRHFIIMLGIDTEEDVIGFYSNMIKTWIEQDILPSDEVLQSAITDINMIRDTLWRWEETPGKHKAANIFGWDKNAYEENIKQLKGNLLLFSE
ncbi:hypothetical protein BKP35_08650 [Anaerobacillus arseniciselenatis]|uniref:Uncharacterized protein n=1 Tax=Anaerobacillus arseniciselenatis TaxID=85682 RepID=A0A1S2LR20_9BACI|nr:hypothetical protein [Anaerobacillus arseniciselenatis]OIJ13835.1 hypothetical protein BKP35_08650 [Anaerobacillus arseniciselenatis]